MPWKLHIWRWNVAVFMWECYLFIDLIYYLLILSIDLDCCWLLFLAIDPYRSRMLFLVMAWVHCGINPAKHQGVILHCMGICYCLVCIKYMLLYYIIYLYMYLSVLLSKWIKWVRGRGWVNGTFVSCVFCGPFLWFVRIRTNARKCIPLNMLATFIGPFCPLCKIGWNRYLGIIKAYLSYVAHFHCNLSFNPIWLINLKQTLENSLI